jgi:hypothetical protein
LNAKEFMMKSLSSLLEEKDVVIPWSKLLAISNEQQLHT